MRDSFEDPVWLLIGLGFPHKIDSVSAAYRFLSENPALNRDAAYNVVIKACRSVLAGTIDAATVRGLVERFAMRRGIFVQPPPTVVFWRRIGEGQQSAAMSGSLQLGAFWVGGPPGEASKEDPEIVMSDVFAKSVGGTDRPILAFGRPMELLISGLETRDLLTEEERSVLRALPLQEASFRAGQEIVREGSTPTFSSLLVRGLAARSQILADGSRQICAFHVPGGFDLHSYLLNEMDHGVQAMSEAQLLQVPHAALRALTDSHPHLARLLWLMTLIDAATHRAWIASIGKRAGAERLAHLICEMFKRMEAVGLVEAHSFVSRHPG